jgi:hypothetical protein
LTGGVLRLGRGGGEQRRCRCGNPAPARNILRRVRIVGNLIMSISKFRIVGDLSQNMMSIIIVFSASFGGVSSHMSFRRVSRIGDSARSRMQRE